MGLKPTNSLALRRLDTNATVRRFIRETLFEAGWVARCQGLGRCPWRCLLSPWNLLISVVWGIISINVEVSNQNINVEVYKCFGVCCFVVFQERSSSYPICWFVDIYNVDSWWPFLDNCRGHCCGGKHLSATQSVLFPFHPGLSRMIYEVV